MTDDEEKHWFVMRDLTRSNAKLPAYKLLDEKGIENFTPMTQKIFERHGKRERRIVPFIHDLIFVHDSRKVLDPIVEKVETLQYRFLKGRKPMTVRDKEMDAFKAVVMSSPTVCYYRSDEITAAMRRRKIRIIGGSFNGCEGYLLSVRGSKHRRLLVELPMVIAAAVEVEPEYIQVIEQ